MQQGFRVFAILGIASIGLVGMKALDIGDELFTLLDPAQKAEAAAVSKKEKKDDHGTANSADAGSHDSPLPDMTAETPKLPVEEDAKCKTASFAQQAGLSEQELRVVMRLSERREQLDKRERDLTTREAVVKLSEKKLDDRLAMINAAIAKYDDRIGALNEEEEKRMAAVVKTYESMEPKKAAGIFNALDDKVLLQVATRMKPRTFAEVLANMDIKKATELTVKMSEQYDPPTVDELLSSKGQEAKADVKAGGSAG